MKMEITKGLFQKIKKKKILDYDKSRDVSMS